MVRELKYNSKLSLDEAEERYKEVRDEFERVKSHYSGLFSRFKKNLRQEDDKILTDCIGVLLPLGVETLVQKQLLQAESKEETLWNKVSLLQYEIMNYLANFKNTGVKRLQGSLGLD